MPIDWPLEPPPLEIDPEATEGEANLLLQRDIQQSMRRIATSLERLVVLYANDIEARRHTV